MILAAGLGTRLRPLTDLLPKPLVPVGDAPMLAHVVARVRDAGCAPIVANAHHHRDEVAAFCRTVNVAVSAEDDLLGTAGGIAHAAPLLGDGDVLVHNGDVLAEIDLRELVRAHEASGAAATLAVVWGDRGKGNVGTDAEGRVVRLRGETFADGEASGGEFTGIHVVSARLRVALPEKGCIVGDVYMPWLRTGRDVLRVVHARSFRDIGSVAGYLHGNVMWLRERGTDTFIGDGARVAPGVTVTESVIGAGARVEGEGLFACCVVWPGVVATAPAVDTVFASHSTQVSVDPDLATR